MISDKKLAVNLFRGLLFVMSYFSLAAFKIVFILQSDYNVSLSYPALSLLSFLDV